MNKDKENNRYWAVGGALSPVYSFRNLYHGNTNETYQWEGGTTNELNEKAIIAFSGGFDVEYTSDRFSLSSGLYYSQMGQQTNSFSVNTFFNSNTNPVIFASTSIGNVVIQETDGQLQHFNLDDGGNYAPNMLDTEPVSINAKVSDKFEFVELPIIANYKIIDRKLDVGVLAGISTSFLVNSKTTITYLGQDLILDDYNNLSKISYNSIFGFGMQYPFTDRLRVKLQPVFKYTLNSLNKDYSVEYHPYSFSIYTGVSLDF